tara:strand:- start:54 stop:755 length:702 start_codon:yes stop_codon:yes gene_type:complete
MNNSYKIITDKQADELIESGFVKLPQIKNDYINKDKINQLINSRDRTYSSSTDFHKEYIEKNKIYTCLKCDLNSLAKQYLKTSQNFNDTYEITRITKGTQKSESYLGHFDSHLFTLVTPVLIPFIKSNESGQLIIFPKIRQEPKNEIQNIFGKIYYKQFHSKERFMNLMAYKKHFEFNFQDNIPLLFLGRVSLHGNRGFADRIQNYRITLLTHFFDTSPKYGIGNILRKIRSR